MLELLEKGGLLIYPIGLCSILAVAIILERLWQLRRSRVVPEKVIRRVETRVLSGDVNGAMAVCETSKCAFSAIMLNALRLSGKSRALIKESVEEAGQKEMVILERYLTLLGTIAAIAPLLGLLGTVLGMIKVFAVISTVGVGDPGVLAAGISEALISTAAGLSVAIPTLVMHRHFQGVIDRYAVELEHFSLIVVEHIKGYE
ncbi:MAG: MotA/TolQ/ExbB proton channel family protein [Magnetococcales bacterium]|nr:MotA/TolQ/ExbB proton channel family protein [Magnetococcales bacterium]